MFEYVPSTAAAPGFAFAGKAFMGVLGIENATSVGPLLAALDSPDASLDTIVRVLDELVVVGAVGVVEIVDTATRHIRFAVRGDVLVDLDKVDASRLRRQGETDWVTADVRGVSRLRVSVAAINEEVEHLPLACGAVPACEVALTLSVDAPTPEPVAMPKPAADAPQADTPNTSPRIDLERLMRPTKWKLRLPDGNEIEAGPRIVVGRRPWRTDPHETSTYYIVAPSPKREISGKHIELEVVGDELHARDLCSTNGTVVFAPSRPPRLLHDGGDTILADGDALDLGEDFRIVVGLHALQGD